MSGEIIKGPIQPIKPGEVVGAKIQQFPDKVIDSFNTLIAQKFVDGQSCVLQDDVVALMVQLGLDREEIFTKGWLNVEGVYRKAGWVVSYDKPGFNESYLSSFTFRPSKKKG